MRYAELQAEDILRRCWYNGPPETRPPFHGLDKEIIAAVHVAELRGVKAGLEAAAKVSSLDAKAIRSIAPESVLREDEQ